jgi:hypothetical protein
MDAITICKDVCSSSSSSAKPWNSVKPDRSDLPMEKPLKYVEYGIYVTQRSAQHAKSDTPIGAPLSVKERAPNPSITSAY